MDGEKRYCAGTSESDAINLDKTVAYQLHAVDGSMEIITIIRSDTRGARENRKRVYVHLNVTRWRGGVGGCTTGGALYTLCGFGGRLAIVRRCALYRSLRSLLRDRIVLRPCRVTSRARPPSSVCVVCIRIKRAYTIILRGDFRRMGEKNAS